MAWFLTELEFDAATGAPIRVREWPRPGGVLEQDARLVSAVQLLLHEWRYLPAVQQLARPRRRDDEPTSKRRRR